MKVVLAYDGSEHSKNAVNFLSSILKPGDEVHLLTVVKEISRGPESAIIESEEKASEMLKEAVNKLSDFRTVTKIERAQDVADSVINYCSEIGCDLIVSGSRGLTGLRKMVGGSVSSALVTKSKVPVMVVK